MDLSILFIAVALAMDAFAVSVSNGIPIRRLNKMHMLRFGIYFGVFQGGMAALGFLVGRAFAAQLQVIDHWIAFGLLAFIGARMLKEGFDSSPGQSTKDAFTNHKTMVLLSLATSIDALAAGVGLSMVESSVWGPAIAITLVTFVLSGLGVFLGYRIGRIFERWAIWLGGFLLIGMGLKILIEHLVQGI